MDEIEETYKWTLIALIEVMDCKDPMSIVIDNDKAMHNAIKCIFPKGMSSFMCLAFGKECNY